MRWSLFVGYRAVISVEWPGDIGAAVEMSHNPLWWPCRWRSSCRVFSAKIHTWTARPCTSPLHVMWLWIIHSLWSQRVTPSNNLVDTSRGGELLTCATASQLHPSRCLIRYVAPDNKLCTMSICGLFYILY